MTSGTTMRVRIVCGAKTSAPTTSNSTALVVNSIRNGDRTTTAAALVNAQIMNGTNRAMPKTAAVNVNEMIGGVVLFMKGAMISHPQPDETGITTDRNVPGS